MAQPSGTPNGKGPLAGLRIVEFAAIGPVPYAVMLLADMGAEVLRILRDEADWPDIPVISRGRADIILDLKSPAGQACARDAMAAADIVVEGFRPGVMERLGLGPEPAMEANPRLIYARMTGWGQDGPIAHMSGHDINFLALSGLLGQLKRDATPPDAPLNLLGDYAAGSLFLVIGIFAALMERHRSGFGQIIDAAIIDGAASLLAPILGMAAVGLMEPSPAHSMLAGRAPYYRTYGCADGKDVAVGSLEPRFRARLAEGLGLTPADLDGDPAAASARVAGIFATAPRDHWMALFEGQDLCISPVLSLDEARNHPQIRHRACYVEQQGLVQPASAPRLSRTPMRPAPAPDLTDMLARWNIRPPE